MAKGDAAAGPVSLDLIPASLIAPRLRKVAAVAVGLGVVVGAVVGIFTSLWTGVLVGAIIALPTALSALLTLRRRIWISGNVVHAQSALRSKSVDLSAAATTELQVRAARVSQLILRVGDGNTVVSVPLALYTEDGGRELEVLGLRSLADALVSSELAPALAMSTVLVAQLRAEARGAGLEERPLYRAVHLAKDAGRVPQTVLTDQEVVGLTD
ncbi:hypothetical protein [Rhodococcus tukisamuensis]|uniref:Uncharacterized protein n=1 Tax=Rhodococcus tukisamuensis TaxID=168276 RepID=A0A1G6QNP1_9NOCA|nr:hypothetical protein [Rhodococcus tukisamuensis]SDC93938.1 hypothetical protein SAMN05444580_102143 [Rhodococcus tukisamuensis]